MRYVLRTQPWAQWTRAADDTSKLPSRREHPVAARAEHAGAGGRSKTPRSNLMTPPVALPPEPSEADNGGKPCSACHELKPLTTDFPSDRSRRDGRSHRCRACDNARCRADYAKNREARLEKSKRYARARREERGEHNREAYKRR
jgi:hypothetical protein